MIDVRKLSPPDKDDIAALLAEWPEPESPYIAVNKRWLVSRDGRVWEYYARETPTIPGDPRSGVWQEDVLVAWTGRWRTTTGGQRRKCTIAIPMVRGVDLDALLADKDMYRLERDEEEPAAPPDFDPAIIALRDAAKSPVPMTELAEQGVQAAKDADIEATIAENKAAWDDHREDGGGI